MNLSPQNRPPLTGGGLTALGVQCQASQGRTKPNPHKYAYMKTPVTLLTCYLNAGIVYFIGHSFVACLCIERLDCTLHDWQMLS